MSICAVPDCQNLLQYTRVESSRLTSAGKAFVTDEAGSPTRAIGDGMKRLCYSVATSLDGYIAGPEGEYDWIVNDPTMDLAAQFSGYDTLLMGRLTYELAQSQPGMLKTMGMKVVVVSTTLKPSEHEEATILARDVPAAVSALKAEPGPQPGKDIWLFGGGVLFRSLLDAGLVDSVEVAMSPILLGSGVPLIPAGKRWPLRLEDSKIYPSGIVLLRYG